MTDFDQFFRDTDIAPINDDGRRRTLTAPATWAQGRSLFGGLVTAAAADLMRDAVGDDARTPRVVTTSFLKPMVCDVPATFTAGPNRIGRSAAQMHAEAFQNDARCATFTAVFGASRPSRVRAEAPPRPARPAPDTLDDAVLPLEIAPAFTQHFRYRWTDGGKPFSSATEGVIGGWCRHRTAVTEPLTAVLGLLDAWPPATLPMTDRPAPLSSVTWTAHLLDLSPFDPDGWWWLRAEVLAAGDGYSVVHGWLYRPDGRAAAWMEQLVAVFDR
ncbi:MAG: thioesterase family protein [Acidobacteriota bacterium]